MRWRIFGESFPLLEALVGDPDGRLMASGSVARPRTGRKRFYRVDAETPGPALFVKVFQVPAGWARIQSLFRPSKAARERQIAEAVRDRGFEVALPIAVGEERRLGALRRSLTVVPELEGRDLRALLAAPETTATTRRSLVVEFAKFARRLHETGIDQDDFSPNNFLVESDGSFVLLDFERCRVGHRLGARRWTLLAKLHRHDLSVSRTDRLRFLRAYTQGDRAARRDAWKKIERAFWRVRRHDARRAARAAFQVGRSLTRTGDIWTVRGRESSPVRRLELGDAARAAWILSHQLERLSLPALPPVRLGPGWLELEEPASNLPDNARPRAIAGARRRLDRYGSFHAEPAWAFDSQGAHLADPTCFRLRF
ncbi:MAG: lipopolysaccharide kinase InaA family protein [Myxococcota bacterium]